MHIHSALHRQWVTLPKWRHMTYGSMDGAIIANEGRSGEKGRGERRGWKRADWLTSDMPALCSHPIMGLPRHSAHFEGISCLGSRDVFWWSWWSFISSLSTNLIPRLHILRSGRSGTHFLSIMPSFRLFPPLGHAAVAFPLLSNVCILGERISVCWQMSKGPCAPEEME